MNIFYLNKNPEECAKMHCDKHVVKMILESAQMLCTTHRHLDQFYVEDNDNFTFTKVGIMKDDSDAVYKTAYLNHPSTIWVRQSDEHYNYLYRLFVALCDEYTYRYGKVHLTDKKLRKLLSNLPERISKNGFKEPPQCMPDEYKNENTIQAYQNYYMGAKKSFMFYTKREVPNWLSEWKEMEV